MNSYFDEDFSVQPKVVNGERLKGNGGAQKKNSTKSKKKKNTKEVYNSKHVRIMTGKMENSKIKKS